MKEGLRTGVAGIEAWRMAGGLIGTIALLLLFFWLLGVAF